jgi:hypothetical protein
MKVPAPSTASKEELEKFFHTARVPELASSVSAHRAPWNGA